MMGLQQNIGEIIKNYVHLSCTFFEDWSANKGIRPEAVLMIRIEWGGQSDYFPEGCER